ncbi:MAG: hypothetical protein ACRCS3_05965 [Paracoccaceae bacterium]
MCRVDKRQVEFHPLAMNRGNSNNSTATDAQADQQARDDSTAAEKRASDHVKQIRSLAQAAVQSMVNAHRNK